MQRSRWKVFVLWVRKKSFLITIIGGFLAAAYSLLRLYYYEPPPNVGLQFRGSVVGYMRPDLGLPDDMKNLWGVKNPSTKVIGMSHFDIVTGWLSNKGSRDADDVELKVEVDGTLTYMKVAGLFDNPDPNYMPPKENILAKGDAVMTPGQYVRLVPMRVDDPPTTIMVFSQQGSVNEITFRYREGDATKTEKYVRRLDSDNKIHFNRVLWLGMDKFELQAFSVRWAYRLAALAVVFFVGYWQRQRLWRWLRFVGKGLVGEVKGLIARFGSHSAMPAVATPPAPAQAPAVQTPTTNGPAGNPAPNKSQVEQQGRLEKQRKRKLRKHEKKRGKK